MHCDKLPMTPRVLTLMLTVVLFLGCSSKDRNAFQGYVEGDFVDVATSLSGRLDSVAVSKGQQIETSEPLFYLDAEAESAALRQAQMQAQAAESQLQDLQQGRRPQEVDVIKAQLEQAMANEELLTSTLRRQEAVFKTGGISVEELDVTRAQVELASARVRELQSQLRVARLPAREDQIKAQQAQVAAANAAVEQSAWRLGQKAVKAPTDGLVFDVLYQTGEWIAPGAPVVRLLPPGNSKIRFFVPEPLVSSLKVGQSVHVRVDGRDADVPATISYISVVAEYTPPIIYSNENRSKLVFMAEAVPVRPLETALNIGQPVSVFVP